jgi:hypothetical protein
MKKRGEGGYSPGTLISTPDGTDTPAALLPRYSLHRRLVERHSRSGRWENSVSARDGALALRPVTRTDMSYPQGNSSEAASCSSEGIHYNIYSRLPLDLSSPV